MNNNQEWRALEFPLSSSMLLRRTQKILYENNIHSIDLLCSKSYEELLKLPHFGKECLLNLINCLKMWDRKLCVMPSEDYLKKITSVKKRRYNGKTTRKGKQPFGSSIL